MKEDFVTYDIAVKLREKEFNIDTDFCYNQDGGIVRVGTCPAPQIHEVLKWLREEKKLYIEIWWLTQHTTKNLKGFQFVVTPISENPQRETDLELYCDYETAAIKGIEYVIDNLI